MFFKKSQEGLSIFDCPILLKSSILTKLFFKSWYNNGFFGRFKESFKNFIVVTLGTKSVSERHAVLHAQSTAKNTRRAARGKSYDQFFEKDTDVSVSEKQAKRDNDALEHTLRNTH